MCALHSVVVLFDMMGKKTFPIIVKMVDFSIESVTFMNCHAGLLQMSYFLCNMVCTLSAFPCNIGLDIYLFYV